MLDEQIQRAVRVVLQRIAIADRKPVQAVGHLEALLVVPSAEFAALQAGRAVVPPPNRRAIDEIRFENLQ